MRLSSSLSVLAAFTLVAAPLSADTIIDFGQRPPDAANTSIAIGSPAAVSGLNTLTQNFTLTPGTTDLLFDSFTVQANTFIGSFNGDTYVSPFLAGYLVELDSGANSVTILNSSASLRGPVLSTGAFSSFSFEPRAGDGSLFELDPTLGYALLVTTEGVNSVADTTGQEYLANLLTLPLAATTTANAGLRTRFALSEADIASSTGLGTLLTGSNSDPPLDASITLVPEPSVAALLAAGGLAMLRRRRAA